LSDTRDIARATTNSPRLLWTGHVAVWLLAGLSARLSRVGAQVEAHARGLDRAQVAPEHLRQILIAPTTEFNAISLIGVSAALVLAIMLRKHSPALLRRVTTGIAVICLLMYAVGYGLVDL
jgi:hypothetical protein